MITDCEFCEFIAEGDGDNMAGFVGKSGCSILLEMQDETSQRTISIKIGSIELDELIVELKKCREKMSKIRDER